jgi:2-polyprenyl-3-methyl-5-hydroxy-6-metoxy-1,4-benzoquinol methylase
MHGGDPDASAMAIARAACWRASETSPSYVARSESEAWPSTSCAGCKLLAGAQVADVGTGQGVPLVIMAEAYPASRSVGYDIHQPSIDVAGQLATKAGVADQVRFEVADAVGYAGRGYDLICFFDTLHDLGDPVSAAAHARHALAPGGTLMLVEPLAFDDLATNLAKNPGAAMHYGASTFLCVANSLSQPVGLSLGAQAGEARLRAVLSEAGFRHVRRVAENPINMVLEARP